MRVHLTLVAIVVCSFLCISASILAQELSTITVSTHGHVITAGVEVYWDVDCTDPVGYINWGLAEPGGVKKRIWYIRNAGNSDEVLDFQASNWNPLNAQNYMTLNWDYRGQVINPNEVIKVTFTLSVFNNITGINRYSFDISIFGSG